MFSLKFTITLVAVGLASAQSQCKIDLPGAGAFEADTVLYDKITIGKQWYVYFEMKLTNTFNRGNDLIRIRTDSDKKIPFITIDSSRRLLVARERLSTYKSTVKFQLNKWYKIKVHQTKSRSYRRWIEIDGRAYSVLTNSRPSVFQDAQVLLAREGNAPSGSFRNLVIKTDCNYVNGRIR